MSPISSEASIKQLEPASSPAIVENWGLSKSFGPLPTTQQVSTSVFGRRRAAAGREESNADQGENTCG
jgi:hypothetical protein